MRRRSRESARTLDPRSTKNPGDTRVAGANQSALSPLRAAREEQRPLGRTD
jgi:hypothetical protein